MICDDCRDGEIRQAYASLAAAAQDVSFPARGENLGVGRRRRSVDRHARPGAAVSDRRHGGLAVDRDRHGKDAPSAELKTVGRKPRRVRLYGLFVVGRGVSIRQ